MGLMESKSPLERRNTVVRRSQRKSIHGIKSKTASILKDIKKFKGTKEEDLYYVQLKSKIETLQRELEMKEKNLQPEIKTIHRDTLKKVDECWQFLQNKLKENQDKAAEAKEAKEEQDVVEETQEADGAVAENQTVVDEERNLEESDNKRKTVELTLIQIHSNVVSPEDKRKSILKMGGVPVMPGSIQETLKRKSVDHGKLEDTIGKIRGSIEKVEMEISQFVGKKYGKHYNNMKEKLFGYLDEVKGIENNSRDDDVIEQVKLCANYIASCLSFLDEKALDVEENGIEDDVFQANSPSSIISYNNINNNNNNIDNSGVRKTLSHRSVTKTTCV